MDSEFLKSITECPEVFYILKTRKTNGLIFETNKNIVESLIWNYTHFLKKDFLVFLPTTATVESLQLISLTGGVIIFKDAAEILNDEVIDSGVSSWKDLPRDAVYNIFFDQVGPDAASKFLDYLEDYVEDEYCVVQ